MTSKTEIANRALEILGDNPVLDITDNTTRAKACNRAYEPVRRAELRAHPWNFAIRRQKLAADTAAPAFDFARQFTLPGDCLRFLPPSDACDWTPEGGKILTDDAAPLPLRYVADEADPNKFDALFAEALAAKIAFEVCEAITGSSTKKADAKEAYADAIAQAKRVNAFEQPAQDFPEDDWLLARY